MLYPVQAWLCWLLPILTAPLAFPAAKLERRLAGWLSVAVSAASAVMAAQLIPMVAGSQEAQTYWTQWIEALDINASVLLDPLSVFMANVATWIGLLVLIYSNGYMAEDPSQGRYYFFMLLFVGSMAGLVLSGNLLQFYVFWELVGLCSYALIGFWYHKPSAARAGMKAFITTRVGDIFLLAGILMLYMQTGTFDIQAIKVYLQESPTPQLLFIALFMLVGAMGKSAQFPLHVWLPDAMEGPTPVSALIHAATMVKAGVYLLARMHTMFCGLEQWLTALCIVGGITSVVAASAALTETDIKRVLAYSTISQLGLMVLCLGVGTRLAWFATQMHVLSHAIFKALLFLCAGIVMHATGTTDMREMGGLRRSLPTTFAASLVGVLSLSGIPPFSGFWSKELIIKAMLETHQYLPLAAMVSASILTVAYSMRWLYLIFLREAGQRSRSHRPPLSMLLPTLVLAAASVVAGFLELPMARFMLMPLHAYSLSLESLPYTATILVVGFVPFAAFYPLGMLKPEALYKSHLGERLHALARNALYVDALYNKIFVEELLHALWELLERVEVGTIDHLNYSLAWGLIAASKYFRKLQTGILSYNMLLLLIGLVALLALLIVL